MLAIYAFLTCAVIQIMSEHSLKRGPYLERVPENFLHSRFLPEKLRVVSKSHVNRTFLSFDLEVWSRVWLQVNEFCLTAGLDIRPLNWLASFHSVFIYLLSLFKLWNLENSPVIGSFCCLLQRCCSMILCQIWRLVFRSHFGSISKTWLFLGQPYLNI